MTFRMTDVDALAANETEAPTTSASASALSTLSPAMRLLVLSDGSVTRHLRVLGKVGETQLEVLRETREEEEEEEERGEEVGFGPPSDVALLLSAGSLGSGDAGGSVGGGKRSEKSVIVRREVYLRAGKACGEGSDKPAVYASSWWIKEELERFMPNRSASMWSNLRNSHVELHREIREVYCGHNKALEAAFGEPGPFWGRHYIFWSGGVPITIVYEVFNPALRHSLEQR